MNKKYIFIGLGFFILGLVIGISPLATSEVRFGIDDIGAYFIFDRILPQATINAFLSTGLILDYFISIPDDTTQFWYNLNNSNGLTQEQVKDYLDLYDAKLNKYDISLAVDLTPFEPYDCRRSDFNISKVFGYYTLNDGTDFINVDDDFCLEILNGG